MSGHEAMPIAAALAAILVAGCSHTVGGSAARSSGVSSSGAATPTGQATAESCTAVAPPLSTVPSKNAAEPALRLPVPPGWERNTMLDSELIRYVVVNRGLAAQDFAPNAVVTLERVAGTTVTAQQVIDQEKAGLGSGIGSTEPVATPGTTCGLTSETVNYTLSGRGNVPDHPATVLIVVGPFGGDTYAATVTVQAVAVDDPTYREDSQAILAGFQMVPTGG